MTVEQPPQPQHRLLIVDDHEIVRQGLVAMLGRRPGFQVVAEAGTVAEAIEMAQVPPPIWLSWVSACPADRGIEASATSELSFPETRVVMLTSYPDEEAAFSAIVAGASGYLLKQVRARDLVSALEAAGAGRVTAGPGCHGEGPSSASVARDHPGRATGRPCPRLTSQEQKILLLVAEGKTNKDRGARVPVRQDRQERYQS